MPVLSVHCPLRNNDSAAGTATGTATQSREGPERQTGERPTPADREGHPAKAVKFQYLVELSYRVSISGIRITRS